jgi:hypothetical protein
MRTLPPPAAHLERSGARRRGLVDEIGQNAYKRELDQASRAIAPVCVNKRGTQMPTIVGYHKISKGAQHWLTSPKRKEFFGPLGITNIRTFVDPTDSTRVAVMMDVPDMEAVMAAMRTKAAADAMAYDGVVPESLVIMVES